MQESIVKSSGPLFFFCLFFSNFGMLQNFGAKNLEGTDIIFWHPALAVTKCQVVVSEGKKKKQPPEADSTEPATKSQEHEAHFLMTDCFVW